MTVVQSPLSPVKSIDTPNTGKKRLTSEQKWFYAWVAYQAVMYIIIVASGAILFMVLVRMIKFDDDDTKDMWTEVNSQILNAIFSWMAITMHPFFLYRFIMGTIVRQSSTPMAKRESAGQYLSRNFPLVFLNEANEDNTKYVTSDMEHLETVAYNDEDAVFFRNSMFILNWQCIFQYPIAGVMWGYDMDTRPGYIVGIFLPFSFLCNFIGQYRLYLLNKRIKKRREALEQHEGESDRTVTTPRDHTSSPIGNFYNA